jgi:hypothetical protein
VQYGLWDYFDPWGSAVNGRSLSMPWAVEQSRELFGVDP